MLSKWLLMIASGCPIILRDQSSPAEMSPAARINTVIKVAADMW